MKMKLGVLLLGVPGVMFGQAASDCKVIAPDAHDGVLLAPENHHMLYETDDVRVIEVTQAPHTIEPMHTHARPAIFYLDHPSAMRMHHENGSTEPERPYDPNFKHRVIPLKPEGMHASENTGDTVFHALRVELKHPGCDLVARPPVTPGASDAVVAAPGVYKVLFENEDVRVIDVRIPAHSKEAIHTHPWGGFIYVVQAQPLRDWSPDGTAGPVKNIPAGVKVVPAAPAGLHLTENLGDGELHAVRFELKHLTTKVAK